MNKWQVVTTDDLLVKVNTETGETWLLEEMSGEMKWRRIANEQPGS